MLYGCAQRDTLIHQKLILLVNKHGVKAWRQHCQRKPRRVASEEIRLSGEPIFKSLAQCTAQTRNISYVCILSLGWQLKLQISTNTATFWCFAIRKNFVNIPQFGVFFIKNKVLRKFLQQPMTPTLAVIIFSLKKMHGYAKLPSKSRAIRLSTFSSVSAIFRNDDVTRY